MKNEDKKYCKSAYFKLIVFIPFIFIYLILVEKGLIIIDPCACTPGHDYTTGIILLALFPVVAGFLLFFSFRQSNLSKRTTYWICGICPFIFLIISFVVIDFLIRNVEPCLKGTELWHFMFETGCYNNPQPKSVAMFAFMAVFYYLLLILMFKIVNKTSKINLQ